MNKKILMNGKVLSPKEMKNVTGGSWGGNGWCFPCCFPKLGHCEDCTYDYCRGFEGTCVHDVW